MQVWQDGHIGRSRQQRHEKSSSDIAQQQEVVTNGRAIDHPYGWRLRCETVRAHTGLPKASKLRVALAVFHFLYRPPVWVAVAVRDGSDPHRAAAGVKATSRSGGVSFPVLEYSMVLLRVPRTTPNPLQSETRNTADIFSVASARSGRKTATRPCDNPNLIIGWRMVSNRVSRW